MKMKGFTLIELLVVVAIIGILVSILMPSLHRAKDAAKQAVCMSNMSQISKAYTMYSTRNNGFLVSAETSGTHKGPIWVQHSRWNFDTNIEKSPLWPYIKSKSVFQCSGETRHINLTNGNYKRSYSLNVHLNGNGWVTDIVRNFNLIERPANTLQFVDEEDPRGTNLNSFVAGYTNKWVDWPANNHGNKGMPINYVDGHVQIHHFKNKTTSQIDWFFNSTSYEDRLFFIEIANPKK
jgi:prepilin-type N-terminal cleavage/methylation domain-containing protein/prepilin-type processing-associated H-X9-DG protein